MKIGFLGFGEAASNFAKGFQEEGGLELYGYDIMLAAGSAGGEIVRRRMEETGVTPAADPAELLSKAKTIFLVIPAKFARDTALSALPYMTEEHLFCDLTTNTPVTKEELGKTFEEAGCLYTDASVMGAVPIYLHRTPVVASGNGAQEMIRRLTPFGMEIRDVGTEAGRAVRIKLTRSIFVKGAEALTMETLMAARAQGIEEEIVDGIEASFCKLGFTGFCGQLVRSGVLHSERRSLEAKECQELEEELGLDAKMMEATYRKLKWLDAFGLAQTQPDCRTLDDLYELWETSGVLKIK